MSQVLDVLKAIAKRSGADIPEAAKKASDSIDAIQVPEVPDYGGSRPRRVCAGADGARRLGAEVSGRRRLAAQARTCAAMLSPGEYVVSAPAGSAWAWPRSMPEQRQASGARP